MNMNDVLYEAKVVQDRPRVKAASKTPLLIAIICFLLGIVKAQVLLLLIGGIAAAVFAHVAHAEDPRDQHPRGDVAQRVADEGGENVLKNHCLSPR
jgi:hypothetical protein